jgi:cytochrome c oxidase cbb3-type subunit I/II
MREGKKYPDSWHYNHMMDPTTMSPGSLMPAYPYLLDYDLDLSLLPSKIAALRTLGTPYPRNFEKEAIGKAKEQALVIAKSLNEQGIKDPGLENKEIVAIIAYLQRLGTDIKIQPVETSK